MKKLQKGFTLVELIVVITILAILGTIAFISLQGYSQDAKNSKVNSDIRSLVSAIETKSTSGDITVKNLVDGATLTNHTVTGDFGSESFDGTGVTLNTASGNYNVGNVNFIKLGQNSGDFNFDDKGTTREYVVAFAAQGDVAYYQVAGHTQQASGDYEAVVKGNYVDEDGSGTLNVSGLISTASGSTPVANSEVLTGNGLY